METAQAVFNQAVLYGTALYGQCPGYGFWGGGGQPGWFWYSGGHFMMIPLFIVLIVVVYLVARNYGGKRPLQATQETPLDIVRRRYASGEITKEQYESLKADLKA
jgi:putative membrane protein